MSERPYRPCAKTLVWYNSLKSFHLDCPETYPAGHEDKFKAWSGSQTYKQAHARLFQGDRDAVKRSDALLEKIESDGLALKTSRWTTDIVGLFPCVPAHVAGEPEAMFQPVDIASDTAPMRVFASVCLSAGFNAHKLELRGI
ncbi:MAG: hypothetical protein ACREJM_10075, partial [Candidatus Saccharimonadales bacterium]